MTLALLPQPDAREGRDRLEILSALISAPFLLAGILKISYDLLLYRAFVAVRTPEEMGR